MRRHHSGGCQWGSGQDLPSLLPRPLGQLRQGGSASSFLCLPSCSSPTSHWMPWWAQESYLLRSQILRGEKCPQQAVPVTKELPNTKRAELDLACQNLCRKWLHSGKCRAYFLGDGGVNPECEAAESDQSNHGTTAWRGRATDSQGCLARGPSGSIIAEPTTYTGLGGLCPP